MGQVCFHLDRYSCFSTMEHNVHFSNQELILQDISFQYLNDVPNISLFSINCKMYHFKLLQELWKGEGTFDKCFKCKATVTSSFRKCILFLSSSSHCPRWRKATSHNSLLHMVETSYRRQRYFLYYHSTKSLFSL